MKKPTIVKYGRLNAQYSVHNDKRIRGVSIPLKNYRQQDAHSCGFVAALTVARYFDPSISDYKVLRAVRPSVNYGIDRWRLIASLEKLGINVESREDLTVARLCKYVRAGIPVIVSVWPDEYPTDHWTVVQGFSDERVYLTNYRSLPIVLFTKQWSDMDMRDYGGSKEGLVCTLP